MADGARRRRPLIVSFPHTGSELPRLIGDYHSPWLARRDADWWVHELYDFVRGMGATSVRSAISRSVIDLNRDPSGVSLYPGQNTTGLPLTTFDNQPLYHAGREPDEAEIARRRDTYFLPYHDALAAQITRLRARHATVVVRRALDPLTHPAPVRRRAAVQPGTAGPSGAPDTSCDNALSDVVENLLALSGMSQVRNGRFRAAGSPATTATSRAACIACRWNLPAAATCTPLPDQVDEHSWPTPLDPAHAAPLRHTLAQVLNACLEFATNRALHDPQRPIPHRRRADRHHAQCQELADRSTAAHADEQPAPGRGRAPAGTGGVRRHRPRRATESFDAIVETLKRLDDDQTLLVQSGKPVGVFRTHADAPRVLIANSNLVPRWSNWDHFNELDRKGLAMYGQMTAGSWIYIGAQGIVQGTHETFVEMGRQHFGGDLSGKWLFTGGLGGMGGAQPLAAVMAGASCLAVECRKSSIDMRLRTGYLDTWTDNLDEALRLIDESCKAGTPKSVACSATLPMCWPNCSSAA